MKTFDRKDVYSWSNAEDAKQYIGTGGYFADSLADLQECVSNNNVMRLFNICLEPKIDVASVFSLTETDYHYALFIPTDKVKEIEESKKYRPFNNIEEFLNQYKVGQVVHLRNKKNNIEQLTFIVAVFLRCYCCVCLGLNASALPLKELFEEYEIKINEKWQPFGVEE